MLVCDLSHFLDLPDDVPGPARHLAGNLYDIVRAATAGDAGPPWRTALPCRRRPGRRACPGRVIVARHPDGPISWQCSACADAGRISNWENSTYDLRRKGLTIAPTARGIVISDQVAAALRDLALLDPDCERIVYGIRTDNDQALLAASEDELEELIGSVAAEANHEADRRRRLRLDAALDALSDAQGS